MDTDIIKARLLGPVLEAAWSKVPTDPIVRYATLWETGCDFLVDFYVSMGQCFTSGHLCRDLRVLAQESYAITPGHTTGFYQPSYQDVTKWLYNHWKTFGFDYDIESVKGRGPDGEELSIRVYGPSAAQIRSFDWKVTIPPRKMQG